MMYEVIPHDMYTLKSLLINKESPQNELKKGCVMFCFVLYF